MATDTLIIYTIVKTLRGMGAEATGRDKKCALYAIVSDTSFWKINVSDNSQ